MLPLFRSRSTKASKKALYRIRKNCEYLLACSEPASELPPCSYLEPSKFLLSGNLLSEAYNETSDQPFYAMFGQCLSIDDESREKASEKAREKDAKEPPLLEVVKEEEKERESVRITQTSLYRNESNCSDVSKRQEFSTETSMIFDLENSKPKEQINISSLLNVLGKLFKAEELVEKDMKIDCLEQKILLAIVERKFGEKIFEGASNELIFALLRRIQLGESKKRPEENYKFVFKRVLKQMREKFKLRVYQKKRSRKYLSEKAFYESFFGQIAKDRNIPIETYFHPRNTASANQLGHKTINNDYVKDLSLSPHFVREFMIEAKEMEESWNKTVVSKLRSLEKKISESLTQGEFSVAKIVEYISKNPKCKLPWTMKEVKEAIEGVRRLFKLASGEK